MEEERKLELDCFSEIAPQKVPEQVNVCLQEAYRQIRKETEFVNGCEPLAAKHACYKFVSVNSKSECRTSL